MWAENGYNAAMRYQFSLRRLFFWLTAILAHAWAALLLSAIVIPNARGQDRGAATADRPKQVFVRDERCEYFGVRDGRSEKLQTLHGVSICRVSYGEDGEVVSEDLSVFEQTRSGTSVETGNAKNILRATHRYDINGGRIPTFSKTLFSPDVPCVGFEYFYFPMFDTRQQRIAEGTDQIVLLSTPATFVPGFNGSWVYDCRKKGDAYHMAGPYYVASKTGEFLISGSLTKDVKLHPLEVIQMSGDAVVRVRPARAFYGDDANPRALSQVAGLDELVGRFQFRMLPRDSEEAKSIDLPANLKDAADKESVSPGK
jgi:hypothetical protein